MRGFGRFKFFVEASGEVVCLADSVAFRQHETGFLAEIVSGGVRADRQSRLASASLVRFDRRQTVPIQGQPLAIRGRGWDGRFDFDFHRAVRCGYASELVVGNSCSDSRHALVECGIRVLAWRP